VVGIEGQVWIVGHRRGRGAADGGGTRPGAGAGCRGGRCAGLVDGGAAYAAFLENERGALRPGLRADLALLPSDPASCGPSELRELPVRRLWLEGQPVELAGERNA
ncbi:MAG: amidohydrolase family protein, partial [Chloroflexi bacterium]|nr:amidohydrolase family protein [Chloroflexota bacterium]